MNIFWDKMYKGNNRIWGEEPSELAVFAVYYFFSGDARQKLRATIIKRLKPKGLLFLSTLSPKDPQDYAKGIPVPNEHNSFRDKVYLHFCTRNELENEFNFLAIKELCEHEYYELHSTGEVHHHISILFFFYRHPYNF